MLSTKPDLSWKPEKEDLEKRIKSLLALLEAEAAILDKITYKGKNQHRRAFYFQYLLKVRRDVKLLQSANLKEILNCLFQGTNKEKSNSSAKRRKPNVEKHHYEMRLLGVARLLSQMVEPIVKAAFEFSSMLARSFFMGLSLANLALLARLRVLVQQILLDVVSVFNMFSSSRGGQSTILNFQGVEVVREYHPSDNDVIALECVWETDKFVLLEKTHKSENVNLVKSVGDGVENPLESSKIMYQTIAAFLGDDELGGQEDANSTLEDLSGLKDGSHSVDASINISTDTNNEMEVGDSFDDENQEGSPNTSPVPTQKIQTESRRKVAFLSVSKSIPSQMKESRLHTNELAAVGSLAKAANDKEDSFFNLLTAGHIKDSLF